VTDRETLYGFTVEALVGSESAPKLADSDTVCEILQGLAEALGGSQSAHRPSVTRLADGSGEGVSGCLVFPGGTVAIHTYTKAGRLPGRYSVEVTSGERIEPAKVFAVLERGLGTPESFEASMA